MVRAAAAVGLSALAITDHDTLSALPAAADEALRLGIELIPGVEISAQHEGRAIHLLAYFIDPSEPALRTALDEIVVERRLRFLAIARRLAELGCALDPDRLLADLRGAAPGRRHLADWLVCSGQAVDHRSLFHGPLGDAALEGIPKLQMPAERAIQAVRQAGGVVALAHPSYDTTLSRLEGLAGQGLGALEVSGPRTPAARAVRLAGWARALGLVPVAGTDFHAPDRPGRWVGAIATPRSDLERLRSLAARPTSPGDEARQILTHAPREPG